MKSDQMIGIGAFLCVAYFFFANYQSDVKQQMQQLQIQNQLLQTELQGFRDGVIYSQP
jgi:hypothetical protein